MPYKSVKDLPSATKKLSPHQRKIFRSAFNGAYSQYGGDESKAFAVAWSAAQKHGAKDALPWDAFVEDIGWTDEARAAAQLAKQHSAAADRHSLRSNMFAKNINEKDLHRQAASAHREASGNFEQAAGAFRRGASEEAASHMEKGRASAAQARLASKNAGASHFFKGTEEHGAMEFHRFYKGDAKAKDASPEQEITLTMPLLIRLMEFGREDAKDDCAIHEMAEKIAAEMAKKDCLESSDYSEFADAAAKSSDTDEEKDDGKDKEIKVKVKVKIKKADAKPMSWRLFMSDFRRKFGDTITADDNPNHDEKGKFASSSSSGKSEASRGQVVKLRYDVEKRRKREDARRLGETLLNTMKPSFKKDQGWDGIMRDVWGPEAWQASAEARKRQRDLFLGKDVYGEKGNALDPYGNHFTAGGKIYEQASVLEPGKSDIVSHGGKDIAIMHERPGKYSMEGVGGKNRLMGHNQLMERLKKATRTRDAIDQAVPVGWSSLHPTSPAEKVMPPLSPAEAANQQLSTSSEPNGDDRQKRKIKQASREDDRQKRNIRPVTDPTSEYPSPSGAEHVQLLHRVILRPKGRKTRDSASKRWRTILSRLDGD